MIHSNIILVVSTLCFVPHFTCHSANFGDINDISRSNLSQSRIKRIVVPGTSWCGVGKVTTDKDEIGYFYDTDICCRAHDLCPRKKTKLQTTPKTPKLHIDDDSASTPPTMEIIIPTEFFSTQPVTSAPVKQITRPYQPPSDSYTEANIHLPSTISPERRRPARPLYFEQVYEHPQTSLPPIGYVPRNNPGRRTRRWSMGTSDCGCDRKFYECLEKADNLVSKQVGNMYFNIFHRHCQTFDHPISRCITRQGLLGWRCIEYELDTTKPMEIQTRDNPYFYFIV